MVIEIPEKLDFLFKPKRFKIAFGGRGGAKTVSFSKALLFLAMREKKRVLCLREFMNSIDDSVHSALKDEIEILGMSHFYRVTDKQIIGKNGSVFRYAALARNLASIKSKHDYDIAWLEEGETVTQKSLDVLIPTIRKEGSELWISFNPDDEFGSVYQMIKPYLDHIKSKGFYENEYYYIRKINLEDNPFAPKELINDSETLQKTNYKKWLHIYGGEPFSDYKESIIQPEWFEAALDAHLKIPFKPLGIKSVGFDLADTGDAKATAMRHGSVITKFDRWDEGELPEAIDRAFQNVEEWGATENVYDDDGLGKSMKVYLVNVAINGKIVVTPFNGNGKVHNPEMIYADGKSNKQTFRNLRAQYYWYLADRFEATYNAVKKGVYTNPENMISISSDIEDLDILKSEITKIQRKKGGNTFIQIESKEDMRKRGVKSPNMADALMMCFANPPPATKIKPLVFESEFR